MREPLEPTWVVIQATREQSRSDTYDEGRCRGIISISRDIKLMVFAEHRVPAGANIVWSGMANGAINALRIARKYYGVVTPQS